MDLNLRRDDHLSEHAEHFAHLARIGATAAAVRLDEAAGYLQGAAELGEDAGDLDLAARLAALAEAVRRESEKAIEVALSP